MKRIIIALAVLFPSIASAANYSDFFFKPYIGADYQYTDVNFTNISGTPYNYGDVFADSFSGGDVHIGARVHKNLGFELGYSDTLSESKSNILGSTASSSSRIDAWTLDAMGYLPLGASQKFELIGDLGMARTNATGSVTISGTRYSESGFEYRPRAGVGAQYWLTDNLNVRGLVYYQDASFHSTVNDAIVGSLGVNWQF